MGSAYGVAVPDFRYRRRGSGLLVVRERLPPRTVAMVGVGKELRPHGAAGTLILGGRAHQRLEAGVAFARAPRFEARVVRAARGGVALFNRGAGVEERLPRLRG